jgi:sulfite exporter TauE/SafE
MSQELLILIMTAASIGFFHTLLGPDHYLPFIVMARARKWLPIKTIWVTTLCGIGHILSSVALGFIGIAFGITVTKLVAVESFRGSLAAWALIAFGLVYFVWGLHRAVRNRPHRHAHVHGTEQAHSHEHAHEVEHTHVHDETGSHHLTPWILFTIFLFGPCEPLIPILMYPAAQSSSLGVFLVASVFGVVTILTMLTVVLISSLGVNIIPMGRLERYTHALAGATICLSGLAIQFLGL